MDLFPTLGKKQSRDAGFYLSQPATELACAVAFPLRPLPLPPLSFRHCGQRRQGSVLLGRRVEALRAWDRLSLCVSDPFATMALGCAADAPKARFHHLFQAQPRRPRPIQLSGAPRSDGRVLASLNRGSFSNVWAGRWCPPWGP